MSFPYCLILSYFICAACGQHEVSLLQLGSLASQTAYPSAIDTDSKPLLNVTTLQSKPYFSGATFQGLPTSMNVALVAVLLWASSKSSEPQEAKASPTASWTGLRAALACFIFVEHLGWHFLFGGGAFIVLSGAVLTIGKTCTISCGREYVKYLSMRLFRIFPALWVAQALRYSNLTQNGTGTPIQALLLMPFSHPALFFAYESWSTDEHDSLWFVSTVIFLYAVCPFLDAYLTSCGTRKCISKCVLLGILCYSLQLCLAAFASVTPAPEFAGRKQQKLLERDFLGYRTYLYCNPLARLPQFILGIIVSHSLHALDAQKKLGTSVCSGFWGVATDLAVLFILGLAWYTKIMQFNKFDNENLRGLSWLFTSQNLWSPIFALVMLSLGYPAIPSVTKSILSHPAVMELGKWSFGVYLYGLFLQHGSACHVNHDCTPWGYFGLYASTVLAGFTSYHLLEEPSQRFVRWIWLSSQAGQSECGKDRA